MVVSVLHFTAETLAFAKLDIGDFGSTKGRFGCGCSQLLFIVALMCDLTFGQLAGVHGLKVRVPACRGGVLGGGAFFSCAHFVKLSPIWLMRNLVACFEVWRDRVLKPEALG